MKVGKGRGTSDKVHLNTTIQAYQFTYTGVLIKSLARPRKETSYSEQDLQYYTKSYGVKAAGI